MSREHETYSLAGTLYSPKSQKLNPQVLRKVMDGKHLGLHDLGSAYGFVWKEEGYDGKDLFFEDVRLDNKSIEILCDPNLVELLGKVTRKYGEK